MFIGSLFDIQSPLQGVWGLDTPPQSYGPPMDASTLKRLKSAYKGCKKVIYPKPKSLRFLSSFGMTTEKQIADS